MADDSGVIARMQDAQRRARAVIHETLVRSKTEVVDRPYDGKPLTKEERDNYSRSILTPGVAAVRAAEMATRYNLTKEKPFPRRVVDRINMALRDLQEER